MKRTLRRERKYFLFEPLIQFKSDLGIWEIRLGKLGRSFKITFVNYKYIIFDFLQEML